LPSHKPALIFDRLLALSEELVLDDELSPTQAWFHLVQQPWTSTLDLDVLRGLSSSLLKLIKCHGYVYYAAVNLYLLLTWTALTG
jgi:hypothetical protein